MPSSGWESADLLTRFNALAGRPTADAITDPQKYQRLADAQDTVVTKISGITKSAFPTAPAAMTSADGGYTWTFGTDGNGYALYPYGAGVYPSLTAVPDYPWMPGVDYLDEGVRIRIPNNIAWSGPLYWYGVTPPQQISASVQPILQPPPARILIVVEAVRSFAEEYLRNAALADQMAGKFERAWGENMTLIRKHLRGNGRSRQIGFPVGIASINGGTW